MSNDPIMVDYSEEAGEERWRELGATADLRVLLMIFTFRGDQIRPTSAWGAGNRLREFYFNRKGR